jgi:hypothetical protein
VTENYSTKLFFMTFKKDVLPYLLTAVTVIVVLIIWSAITKQVQVDEKGKRVAGSPRIQTRFGWAVGNKSS